jgi:hypothetical protein
VIQAFFLITGKVRRLRAGALLRVNRFNLLKIQPNFAEAGLGASHA